MTARYTADSNSLQELPSMEKPEAPTGKLSERRTDAFYHATANYQTHLATLRNYDCHPSCIGKWEDGQILTEGQDYEIHSDEDRIHRAFPISVKSEEDLWVQLFLDLYLRDWDNGTIQRMKGKYTLTKN